MMESTIALYKTELIGFEPRRMWRDAREVETETASWIYWCNHMRVHSSIGDVPPTEYEQDYEKISTARKAWESLNRSIYRTQADSSVRRLSS